MKQSANLPNKYLTQTVAITQKINQIFLSQEDIDKQTLKLCHLLADELYYGFVWIAIFNDEGLQHFNFAGQQTTADELKKILDKENQHPYTQNVQQYILCNKQLTEYANLIAPLTITPFYGGLIGVIFHEEETQSILAQQQFIALSQHIALALSTSQKKDDANHDGTLPTSFQHTHWNISSQHKQLIDSLPHPLLLVQNSITIYANPVFYSLFGFSKEEIIGENISKFISNEEIEKTLQQNKASYSNKALSIQYETQAKLKSGQRIDIILNIVPINYNNLPTMQILIQDITKQKNTIDQLKKSEDKASFLAKSTFEGIVIHKNGVILNANDAFLKLTGYSRNEAIGSNLLDYLHNDEEKALVVERMMQDSVKPYTVTGTTKNKQFFTAEIEAKNVIHNGEQVRIVALRDVTERMNLLHQIAKSEQRLNTLLGNLPGMAYTCKLNSHWDMQFISEGCFDLLGYTPAEITNSKLTYNDLIHPDDRDYVRNAVKNAVHNNEVFELEYRIITKTGETKWVWEKGRQINPNQGSLLDGFVLDITERKQAEDALRKFKTISDKALYGSLINDPEGNILYINNYFAKIHGYTPSELIGKHISIFHNTTQHKKAKQLMEMALKTGHLEAIEIEHTHKNGAVIPMLKSLSYIYNEKSQLAYVATTAFDLTETKKAQTHLKKSEKKFRSIFENKGTATAIIDTNSNFLKVNSQCTKLLGYSTEEFEKGMKWIDIAHPEDLPKMLAQQELRKSNPQKALAAYEIRLISKDKSIKHVLLYIDIIPETNERVVSVVDITEREIAEQNLKTSEERLKSYLQNAPYAIFIANQNGEYLHVNPYAEALTGYSSKELLERKLQDILPEQDKLAAEKSFMLMVKKGNPIDIETGFITKKGEKRRWHIKAVKISEKRFLGYANDITQRKKDETRLHQLLHDQNIILNNDPTLIIFKDTNNNILRITKTVAEFTGLPKEQIEGKHSSVIYLNMANTFYQDDLEVIRTGKPKLGIIERIVTANGSIHWLLTNKVPYAEKNAKITGIIVFSTDITQLKTFEDELLEKNKQLRLEKEKAQESEEKHRFLFENMTHGVIYINNSGDIDYINHAAASILCLDPSNLKGINTLIPPWEIVNEDGSPCPNNMLPTFRTINSGKSIEKEVLGIYMPTIQEYRWVNINCIPKLAAKSDKPEKVIVTFEDISFLKKKENELKKAKEKAEESDRLKSAFLSNMSHEIRTPMNGIIGFTELLKEPNLTGETQKKYIDIIQRSGQRMTNTINDLINISKIESGMEITQIAEVDIANIVSELYQFFKPEANKKGIQLIQVNGSTSSLSTMHTDADKLISILTNLIKNAIKFTHTGTITIHFNLSEKECNFEISDTGIGISSKRQEAVFDRFVQADIEDVKVYEGSGLGLSIAKEYVNMLNGVISLESEEGKGTKFYVKIPNMEQNTQISTEKQEARTDSKPEEPKRIKILVAEDDDTSYAFLEVVLSEITEDIIRAENGEEAVELCRNNPELNIILMDIKMPVMNGLDATLKIREFNPNIMIIAQTAYAMKEDVKKTFEVGCNDYISKPIDRNLLIKKILRLTRG